MDPEIFDWRAVTWASIYPKLDPQKIIHGSQNQCMSCAMIKEALHSVGFDLDMTHNKQNLSLSLFHMSQGGSLRVSAHSGIDEVYKSVDLYTVLGESAFALLMAVDLCIICEVLESRDYATD
jgi:hypothetical protein